MFRRRRIRLRVVLALSVLPVVHTQAGETGCGEPAVTVVDRSRPGCVELIVRQRVSWDVTVMVDVTSTGLIAEGPVSRVRSFAGRGDHVFGSWRFACPGEPWHLDWNLRCHRSGSNSARHDPDAVYDLPFAPGRAYAVTQGPHNSATWMNGGCAYDFDMPEGAPVHAAREGRVTGLQDLCPDGVRDTNFVVVRHADGTLGDYEHLRPGGVAVRVGQWVKSGDLLGWAGHTGTGGPHLHFGVIRTEGCEWIPQRIRFRARGYWRPVTLRQGRTYVRRPGSVR